MTNPGPLPRQSPSLHMCTAHRSVQKPRAAQGFLPGRENSSPEWKRTRTPSCVLAEQGLRALGCTRKAANSPVTRHSPSPTQRIHDTETKRINLDLVYVRVRKSRESHTKQSRFRAILAELGGRFVPHEDQPVQRPLPCLPLSTRSGHIPLLGVVAFGFRQDCSVLGLQIPSIWRGSCGNDFPHSKEDVSICHLCVRTPCTCKDPAPRTQPISPCGVWGEEEMSSVSPFL